MPSRVRITRSSGARLRRISSALVSSMIASPTASTRASETSTREETLSGETTSTSVPTRKTAPLIRQIFQ